MKEAFNWTLQTMDLLRWLNSVLLDTVEAWKSFNSPNGDIIYFRNTDAAAISPNTHCFLTDSHSVCNSVRRSTCAISLAVVAKNYVVDQDRDH